MMFKDIEWQKRGKINRNTSGSIFSPQRASAHRAHSFMGRLHQISLRNIRFLGNEPALDKHRGAVDQGWCVGLYGFEATYLAVITPLSRIDQSTSVGKMGHAFGLFSVALLCICHASGLSQHLRRPGPITHDYS